MLPGMPQSTGSADEKRLRKLYRDMCSQDQATLMRFAEFLTGSPTLELEPMTENPGKTDTEVELPPHPCRPTCSP